MQQPRLDSTLRRGLRVQLAYPNRSSHSVPPELASSVRPETGRTDRRANRDWGTRVRSKTVASLGSYATRHATRHTSGSRNPREWRSRTPPRKVSTMPQKSQQLIGFAADLPYSRGSVRQAADLRDAENNVYCFFLFFAFFSTRITHTRLNPAEPSSVRRNRTPQTIRTRTGVGDGGRSHTFC